MPKPGCVGGYDFQSGKSGEGGERIGDVDRGAILSVCVFITSVPYAHVGNGP